MTESPGHAAEPAVNIEQLERLLALGTETVEVDFKRSCDLSTTRAKVELAKDVAAMQVEGGYLVIGADDSGHPVPPGVPLDQLQRFDEANLRPMLAKWIPEPFELRSASHIVGGSALVILYVAPRDDGFCVFSNDGKYEDAKGREQIVFRAGEVFVRHGTTSERWRQADVERIRQRLVAQAKESWRAALTDDLVAMGIARRAQALVDGPAITFTWKLDTEMFDSATLELLRRGDDVALRRAMYEGGADAADALASNDPADLVTLIGRMTSIAAQALTYERMPLFQQALDAILRIYRLGFDTDRLRADHGKSEDLWLICVEHLMGLGALAVRLRNWSAVRSIATVAPGDANDYYPSWLRHGLTMAARARKLEGAKSLVTLAAGRVQDLPALRPDIGTDDENLVSSICQFDMLAALAVIDATQSLKSSGWYTNFARFYTRRTEPAVEQLLEDPSMRQTLFPGTDQELADALREIERLASQEGRTYNGFDGFGSAPIRTFITSHKSPS